MKLVVALEAALPSYASLLRQNQALQGDQTPPRSLFSSFLESFVVDVVAVAVILGFC